MYKFYYVHVSEVMERFHELEFDEAKRAFVMYVNFENLTESLKKNAKTLEIAFSFPIKLPAFYRQNSEMTDILKSMLMEKKQEAKQQSEGAKSSAAKQSKVQGMDKQLFAGKASQDNTTFDDKNKK